MASSLWYSCANTRQLSVPEADRTRALTLREEHMSAVPPGAPCLSLLNAFRAGAFILLYFLFWDSFCCHL